MKSSPVTRIATLGSVVIAACLGAWALWSNAAPSDTAPIVLGFKESPIFLGPHEHGVTAIAFSPDGKTIATGSHDGFLRFWDLETGRLKSIHGEDATRGISGLAYSPDGNHVAIVGGLFGKEAVLWDAASGQIARSFEEPVEVVSRASANAAFIYKGKPINYRVLTAVAFSPDGSILATASDGVILRDAKSGQVLATLKQPAKGVKAIAFSPDGKTLLTAAEDRKVRLWSVPKGELFETLDGPTQPLHAVAISNDGKRIVAAGTASGSILSRDQTPHGSLWTWDKPNGKPRQIDLGDFKVSKVVFAGPETVLVAAGREVLSLDLEGKESAQRRKIWSHSQDVLALAVSRGGKLMASGGADRTVDLVDLATRRLVHRLPGLNDIVSAVAASPDGQRFATATLDVRFSNRLPMEEESFAVRYKTHFADGANASRMQPSEVRIWSAMDGTLQSMLPLPICQVTAIKFIPQSDKIAVAGWIPEKGGMISIWDLNGPKQVRDLATEGAEVLSISVTDDCRTLTSGNADGKLEAWDIETGKCLLLYNKSKIPVAAVAFSHQLSKLAFARTDHTVQIFDELDVRGGLSLKSRSLVESLEFSPDGQYLAAGTRDAGFELWDLTTKGDSITLAAPGDHFDAMMPGFIAFSPNGRLVACGGHGKDIAIFDAPAGKLRCELGGHYHAPTAAVFLPDGRLVSGAEERTVRLWDVDSEKSLATWVIEPANPEQKWADEWVGYAPGGEFVGSKNLDRLVGWISGGELIIGAEDARRHRVEKLFQSDSTAAEAGK